jgi:hypothetical protein
VETLAEAAMTHASRLAPGRLIVAWPVVVAYHAITIEQRLGVLSPIEPRW